MFNFLYEIYLVFQQIIVLINLLIWFLLFVTGIICVVENGLYLFLQNFGWVFEPFERVLQSRENSFLDPTGKALHLLLLLHIKFLYFTDCEIKLLELTYLFGLFVKFSLFHSLEYDLIPSYNLLKEFYELFYRLSSGLYLLVKVLLDNHVDPSPLNYACVAIFKELGKLFEVYPFSLIESYTENVDILRSFVLHMIKDMRVF